MENEAKRRKITSSWVYLVYTREWKKGNNKQLSRCGGDVVVGRQLQGVAKICRAQWTQGEQLHQGEEAENKGEACKKRACCNCAELQTGV